MKTENLSIGLRALYHAIEWLTVFLILLIFAVQIITPLYAVRVGRADTFLQQLQWLPYRPGVLALGVMLAAVGTILSKCSHEVDSGFLSRSSWQLYLLEGVLYSASALIFQQNCDKIALFAIVDMVDDPRSLRQKRFLSAMIVVYLFCNMDAATSALHAVTLKQYLAFYSLHTRSVLQLVIESLSALEMILFILYMVLFISQQTSEKQEILNLNQQLQQANEQLRIYAEESAHTAQVQERNRLAREIHDTLGTGRRTWPRARHRLAREIHDTLGHVLTGITAGADACIQMMDDSPEMARHQMELIADTARNGMNDVRRSVKALRPDSLEKENLSGALNKMCTSMAQSSGAQIQLEESLAGLTLSQDEEDCVYRTVQEGITNAIRHGHATRVQVRCHIEDGVLEVSVRDNGIGCKSVTPGFGLQHMQERMLMLGGTFWYENSDGFCIRAEIPLRKTPGSEKRKQEETV
jgi:signal transduction histidine kinase